MLGTHAQNHKMHTHMSQNLNLNHARNHTPTFFSIVQMKRQTKNTNSKPTITKTHQQPNSQQLNKHQTHLLEDDHIYIYTHIHIKNKSADRKQTYIFIHDFFGILIFKLNLPKTSICSKMLYEFCMSQWQELFPITILNHTWPLQMLKGLTEIPLFLRGLATNPECHISILAAFSVHEAPPPEVQEWDWWWLWAAWLVATCTCYALSQLNNLEPTLLPWAPSSCLKWQRNCCLPLAHLVPPEVPWAKFVALSPFKSCLKLVPPEVPWAKFVALSPF